MTTLISQLWEDDCGAVVSVELVLIIGILIFGLIPGLVALRNSVIASMATIGNFLGRITPSFTYSGFAIVGSGGVSTIAQIGGLQIDYTTANQLSGAQVAPEFGGYDVVPPAP